MQLANQQLRLSPTDLVNFLGCKHLTQQDLKVAHKKLTKPDWNQPALAILQQLGLEHETAYLAHLESNGLSVKRLPEHASLDETILAMKEGHDIIAQARLEMGQWRGYADVLRKVPGKSQLGDHYYEVEDTKLAQVTRTGTVIQLCLYSEILTKLQGRDPEIFRVVKPGSPFETETYRFTDFSAYFRLIKKRFEETILAGMKDSYPEPVEKCNTCAWWKICNDQWHRDDHLSLVAGLQTTHRKEINRQGTDTLEDFALRKEALDEKPDQGNLFTYVKLHGQAKVQYQGRVENRLVHEFLDLAKERGLNRLPEPNQGDIYFDFEGEHFYEDGGLEYLFGFVYKEPGQADYSYQGFWALDRVQEKQAFMKFIEFLTNRWEQFPNFYIYHYAPYEPAAIKRLAQRHAVYEDEVDNILRSQRFVDLHRVIKESLQASVESYSLKELEKFAGYTRKIDLRNASEARRRLGAALNLKALERITNEDKTIIEEYNRDDCVATAKLHDWLEGFFQEKLKAGEKVKRPKLVEKDDNDEISRAQQLHDALIAGLPDNHEAFTQEEQAKWHLAFMVDYFWRELKTEYWEYFRLHELTDEELIDERYAIAFMRYDSSYKPTSRSLPVDRYYFDEQEVSLDIGDSVSEPEGMHIGKIHDMSKKEGWVEIKKTRNSETERPISIHNDNIFRNQVLAAALHHYCEEVIVNGFDENSTSNCIHDLVLRKTPRLADDDFMDLQNNMKDKPIGDVACQTAMKLQNTCLPIQGPPGTGKTYVGGQMILELIKAGKKVGVTAVSHKVIQNLMNKVIDHTQDQNHEIRVVHKTDHLDDLKDGYETIPDNDQVLSLVGPGTLVGGTAYFWAREAAERKLDYLFVDEAGQMSLAQVIAAARSAKNLVLLGDPQQLEQPQQGAHPENSDISGMEHLLDGQDTMPQDKGLFLGTTWRLPPPIASFTSELYYEGRLRSKENLQNQRLNGSRFEGHGLWYIPVEHIANQNRSNEEVDAIVHIVNGILGANCTWTDREGSEQAITKEHFRVVAPYNVQVNALADRLPDIMVGTVDKFQGQEAPIVIYSMTASSPDDAPRGMGFLYNPNRFNVATSRAQCVCILVGSPKLLEPECHSINQMRWANGLCRYGEMAKK